MQSIQLPQESTLDWDRSTIRSGRALMLRIAGYSAAFVLLPLLLPWLARTGHSQAFREDGAVEWFQWGAITLATILFFAGAIQNRAWSPLLVCLGLMALVASVREHNNRLAEAIPLGWGIVIALPLLIGIAWLWRQRLQLKNQANRFVFSSAFALLWTGLLTVVVFAQFFGEREIWRALMGDGFQRDIGRAIQEITEAFGYALLLAGAIETLFYIHRASRFESTVVSPFAGRHTENLNL